MVYRSMQPEVLCCNSVNSRAIGCIKPRTARRKSMRALVGFGSGIIKYLEMHACQA